MIVGVSGTNAGQPCPPAAKGINGIKTFVQAQLRRELRERVGEMAFQGDKH